MHKLYYKTILPRILFLSNNSNQSIDKNESQSFVFRAKIKQNKVTFGINSFV